MAPKIRVSPLRPLPSSPAGGQGRSSVDVCLWRSDGVLRLTAIAKATFAFVDQEAAQRIPPSPVFGRDRHVDDNPRRGTIEDFQVAPLIPCAGVTLVGTAHPTEATTSMSVRLGVYRDDEALIEKTLHVFGDRDPNDPNTSGILGRTPLVYERAAQGPLNLAGSALFSVAHATDPALPGCFAPIPLAWRARAFGRRALDPGTMKASPMEIPPGFDFMFFSSAPVDQRIAALRGDEWIILDGLSPHGPRVQTQLPSARGVARFDVEGPRGRSSVPCDLVLDTIGIDSDAGMMSMVFRGHIAIDEAVTRVMVHAGVETPDEPLDLDAPIRSDAPAAAPAPQAAPQPSAQAVMRRTGARPNVPRASEPVDLSAADDDEPDANETLVARISDVRGPALPFKPSPGFQPTQTSDALPSAVPSTEPELTPMRRRDRRPAPVAATPWDRPRPPPPPPRSKEDETVALARSAIVADSGLPFTPSSGASIHSTLPSVGQERRKDPVMERMPFPPVSSAPAAQPVRRARLDQTMTAMVDVTAIDIDPEEIRAQAAAEKARAAAASEAPTPAAPAAPVSDPATMIEAESVDLAPDPEPAEPEPGADRRADQGMVQAAPVEEPPVPTLVEKKPLTLRDQVEAAARSGATLADFTLTSAELSAVDLSGQNLAGMDLSGANLSHARLSRANLDRANLERANLDGADLTGASMQGVVLRGASGAKANLTDAQLDEADLRMARFPHALFCGASLASVQATRADLTSVDMTRANLSSANFRTARIAESKLVDAKVDKADFRDALLTRSDLRGVDRSTARFQGANMDGIRE